MHLISLQDVVRVFDGHTTCCHRRPAAPALGARSKLALRASASNAYISRDPQPRSKLSHWLLSADQPGRHENFVACDAWLHIRVQSFRACQTLTSSLGTAPYHGTTTCCCCCCCCCCCYYYYYYYYYFYFYFYFYFFYYYYYYYYYKLRTTYNVLRTA